MLFWSQYTKYFFDQFVLMDDWTRHLLSSMKWVKRKGTTGKVQPSEKLLQIENFSYRREILRVVLDPDIPLDLVVNPDQTSIICITSQIHVLFEGSHPGSNKRCQW